MTLGSLSLETYDITVYWRKADFLVSTLGALSRNEGWGFGEDLGFRA